MSNKYNNEDNKNSQDIANIGNLALEGYDSSVMLRMNNRCGSGTAKGAKGIAFEVMAVDKQNAVDFVKCTGSHTKLNSIPNDPIADAIRKSADGSTISIQYKDTVSPSGVAKTANSLEKYINNNAEVHCTKEAAEKVNQLLNDKGISKRVIDTGISTKDTSRVADKFLGSMPNTQNITHIANNSGKVGGAVSGALAILDTASNGGSVGECVGSGVSKGAEGYITAAASAAAAEASAGVASAALVGAGALGTVATAGVGLAVGVVAAKVVSDVVGGAFDDVAADIGNAIDDAKFNIELAADTLSETVKGTADIISDLGECALDAANSALESSSAALSDFTDDLGDRICDGIDNFFFGLECLFGL